MPVNQLTAPVIILNEGSVSAASNMPTIAAGNNRIVLVSVYMYNGGGTCNPPSSITCNGRSAIRICGDNPAVAQTRVTSAIYMFFNADVSFISGQALVTSGMTGTVKSIEVQVLQDCEQAPPANFNFLRASTSQTLTIGLTRVNNSLTVAKAFASNAGAVMTLTNPARTSVLDFTTRDVSIAVVADSAGTSNFTCAGSGYTSVNIINFATAVSYSITGVNGGTNSVQIGSSGNTAETTGLTAVTSASLNGVAMTSVAGSSSPWTFSCPPLTDEAVSPYPSGTFSITGAEGSPTLAGVAVTLPTGLTAQVLSGALNTTSTGVLYNFSPAAAVTDAIFYPPVPSVGKYITIDAQGNIDTDYEGTTEFWHWQASTGITRSYDVITGNGGIVTDRRTLKNTLKRILKNALKGIL